MTNGPGFDSAASRVAKTIRLLADGSTAIVRTVVPADRESLLQLHDEASDTSIYFRFFSVSRSLAETFVDRVCSSSDSTWSVVAERRGQLVGVATASREADPTAEVALLVADHAHGLGIGTVLLEELAVRSRRRGVRTLSAEVLAENGPMLRVFHDAGFALTERREREVVEVTLDITPSDESEAAKDARWRRAERESLIPLLEPRSVAVVGVSRRRGRIGREVLENLLVGGYGGQLYAVGRAGLRRSGVHCCETITDLPANIDLVILAVSAPDVEATVRAVAAHGARACVVLTSGLGETSAAGRQVEHRLREVAIDQGMRLLGPNCFGVLSNLRGTRLDATFGLSRSQPGHFALGSQSGGVGIAMLAALRRRGLGLACFVSLGNKADVSGNDLLAAWTDDPDISVASLYLESFLDPRRFVRAAADFSRRKPLLVAFGGTSPAGGRAGRSHTAASATPRRALTAIVRASGAIEVEGVQELVDTVALLTEQPLPKGPRLAVVSNAGGLGVLAADVAQRSGLVLPELVDTPCALTSLLPLAPSTANPIDLGAAARPAAFRTAVEMLSRGGAVDAVLVIAVGTAVTDVAGVCAAIQDGAAARVVPVLRVMIDAPVLEPGATTGFDSAEDALTALVHAVAYRRWLDENKSAGPPLPADPLNVAAVDAPEHWLDADEAGRLAAAAGLTLPPQRCVHDPDEAVQAAEEMGYPVVVKAARGDIVHKTERKYVRTDLRDDEDVRESAQSLFTALPVGSPLLVQRHVSGPELAVGVIRDPRFGSLLMLASGGTAFELWGDQVFLMAPVRRSQIRDALSSLRTWPLFTGFRGLTPVDVDPVIDAVEAVARLDIEQPDVAELDLNPIVCTPTGPICVDVKIRRA